MGEEGKGGGGVEQRCRYKNWCFKKNPVPCAYWTRNFEHSDLIRQVISINKDPSIVSTFKTRGNNQFA